MITEKLMEVELSHDNAFEILLADGETVCFRWSRAQAVLTAKQMKELIRAYEWATGRKRLGDGKLLYFRTGTEDEDTLEYDLKVSRALILRDGATATIGWGGSSLCDCILEGGGDVDFPRGLGAWVIVGTLVEDDDVDGNPVFRLPLKIRRPDRELDGDHFPELWEDDEGGAA